MQGHCREGGEERKRPVARLDMHPVCNGTGSADGWERRSEEKCCPGVWMSDWEGRLHLLRWGNREIPAESMADVRCLLALGVGASTKQMGQGSSLGWKLLLCKW